MTTLKSKFIQTITNTVQGGLFKFAIDNPEVIPIVAEEAKKSSIAFLEKNPEVIPTIINNGMDWMAEWAQNTIASNSDFPHKEEITNDIEFMSNTVLIAQDDAVGLVFIIKINDLYTLRYRNIEGDDIGFRLSFSFPSFEAAEKYYKEVLRVEQ
jgi:hypothetical protein